MLKFISPLFTNYVAAIVDVRTEFFLLLHTEFTTFLELLVNLMKAKMFYGDCRSLCYKVLPNKVLLGRGFVGLKMCKPRNMYYIYNFLGKSSGLDIFMHLLKEACLQKLNLCTKLQEYLLCPEGKIKKKDKKKIILVYVFYL